MVRYGFVLNLKTCIGCGACVAACSEENTPVLNQIKKGAKVPLGGRRDIIVKEEGEFPSVIRAIYHTTCMHCDNPPCAAVCPTGATYKGEGGVVLIDYNLCIGCKYCVTACPYNARYVNVELGGPDKCTMCIHRLKEGELPACAASCPTDSIVFGDLDDPNSKVAKLAKHAVPVGQDLGTGPNVYVIPP